MAGNSVPTLTVPMNSGDVCTLQIPCTDENMGGYWPTQADGFKNGFKLLNEEAGSIVKVHDDKVAIDYQHKSNMTNEIIFESISGDVVRIVAGNIMVHDHASVVTGGPAYGTYATEQQGG